MLLHVALHGVAGPLLSGNKRKNFFFQWHWPLVSSLSHLQRLSNFAAIWVHILEHIVFHNLKKLFLESGSDYIIPGLRILQDAVLKYLRATKKCEYIAIDTSSKFSFNERN